MKWILFIVTILSVVTLTLGIYYGYYHSKNITNESMEVYTKIKTHIDMNAQKVKKMLGDIPIYYINMERSKDRNKFMQDQISKYKVKMERVEAVDGHKIEWKSGMIHGKIPYENKYSRGTYKMAELGCTLSHLYAIYQSYSRGDKIALILEDDVDIGLAALWKQNFQELLKSAPPDWEIINLFSPNCASKSESAETFIPLSDGNGCLGAVAYVVNRKGMKEILEKGFILSGDTFLLADYFIYDRAKHPYIYMGKRLFFMGDFNSQIRHFHRTNYSSLGVRMLDEIKVYLEEIISQKIKSLINLNTHKVKKMLGDIPIYYINMERSKDRNKFMQDQISKYKVKMERVEAVDGHKIEWKSGMIHGKIPYENKYSRGTYKMAELGCTLSHLYAIYQSYTRGDKVALILEDDVDIGLAALWKQNFQELLKSAPPDWEIINLFSLNCMSQSESSETFIPLSDGKECWGTSAYIINRKGMKQILGIYNNGFILSKKKSLLVSDDFIYKLVKNRYVYSGPLLIWINDFISTISNKKTADLQTFLIKNLKLQ